MTSVFGGISRFSYFYFSLPFGVPCWLAILSCDLLEEAAWCYAVF
jgi:hypothetical protein